jgi:hypothetical protein
MSLYCSVESSWVIYCTCHQFEGLASLWRPMPWRQRLKLPRARCGGHPAWRVAHKAAGQNGQTGTAGTEENLWAIHCHHFGNFISRWSYMRTHFKQESFASRLLFMGKLWWCLSAQGCNPSGCKWKSDGISMHFRNVMTRHLSRSLHTRNRFPTGKVRGRCGN